MNWHKFTKPYRPDVNQRCVLYRSDNDMTIVATYKGNHQWLFDSVNTFLEERMTWTHFAIIHGPDDPKGGSHFRRFATLLEMMGINHKFLINDRHELQMYLDTEKKNEKAKFVFNADERFERIEIVVTY